MFYKKENVLKNTIVYAKGRDKKDPLRKFRKLFVFPKYKRKNKLYFLGNSLGLQPKTTHKEIKKVIRDWKKLAVDGHFYATNPWMDYSEKLAAPIAKIVGSEPSEIAIMNSLTVNIHLLFVSFYRPTAQRFKILCEEKPFSSDKYLLDSQLKWHGYSPKEALIRLPYKQNNFGNTESIIKAIKNAGSKLAMVFLGGINYYNGQFFDIEKITKAAHSVGAISAWDLAHAAGNVPLQLKKWKVDFAAWCHYKYLNSGPGSIAAVYINKKYHNNKLHSFQGWWGNEKKTRFKMTSTIVPESGANAWQISNPSIFSLAPLKASLEIFDKTSMETLWKKGKELNEYLEFLLKEIKGNFEIITPQQRGAQLSISLQKKGKLIYNQIIKKGVVVDYREPGVIRIAPVPLYNSFEDVFRLAKIFSEIIQSVDLK